MIQLELITENELKKRFDSLPAKLRDLLSNKQSYQAVVKICQNHHLVDEEKILIIQQLVALIIFGFIHLEDLAREIDEALVLNNHKLSKSLADEIDSKVFGPLKEELEKNYRPIIGASDKPRILSPESSKPMPPRPVMIAEDADLAQKKTVAEKPATPQWKPSAAPQPPQAGGTPPPKMMNEISGQGLGNLESDRMAVKEMEPPKPAPVFRPSSPSAPARPATTEIRPPVNTSKDTGESPLGIVEEIKKLEHSGAELVDVLKKKETTKTAAVPSLPSSLISKLSTASPFQAPRPPVAEKPAGFPNQATGPVIIHQESDQEPIRPMSSFHLEPPSSQFSSPTSKNESRPAVRVEFGGGKQLPETLAKTDVIKPPRVVHYNTFQTPLENPPDVSTPKAPSFAPTAPIARPEMPMPGFGNAQQSTTSTLPQSSAIPKNQGPQKIATVNYESDSMPREGGPATLNSMFSKPVEKHSSWLHSIFSKKTETPSREVSFVQPHFPNKDGVGQAPPLPPRPPSLRTTSEAVPRSQVISQPVPQVASTPVPQKTFDIKTKGVSFESKKENLPPSVEMIDLSSLTKIKDEKSPPKANPPLAEK